MFTCPRCGEELVENALHICDTDVPLLRVRRVERPAPRSSSGLGRIVVGYRPGDRRLNVNRERFGLEAREVRKCMAGCGYPVMFYSGGVDAVNERDAEVICEECKRAHYPELMAEL